MRNTFDLSHQIHRCGEIGRLQTLAIIPVVAGDSFEINLDGIIRLSPFRKEVVSEAQVDIFAFYQPYRHHYGDDWINFVKRGYDENITFTGVATTSGERDLAFLGLNEAPATIPKWLVSMYNWIWDRYFRVPSFDQDTDYLTLPSGTTTAARAWRRYGRLIARLPHVLNGGNRVDGGTAIHRDLDDQDALTPGQAVFEGATSFVDVRDVALTSAQYKSEIDRTWFADRYNDIMGIWETNPNTDADQRPELLMRETFNMSGWDVDGGDDAALGSYIGKAVQRASMNMPRKYFDEHGAIMVLAAVRFPIVHAYEKHPLLDTVNPAADYLLADPTIWAEYPPTEQDPSLWLSNSASPFPKENAELMEPYGQHYRFHPNNVHVNFAELPGYPFTKWVMDTPDQAYYHQAGDYADVFQTTQLAHWQIHARCNVTAMRHVTDVRASIYAGADL